MVPNPNFDVPILEDQIPKDSGRLISPYFVPFMLKIPLESSYLARKSTKFKIGTSKVRFGTISNSTKNLISTHSNRSARRVMNHENTGVVVE